MLNFEFGGYMRFFINIIRFSLWFRIIFKLYLKIKGLYGGIFIYSFKYKYRFWEDIFWIYFSDDIKVNVCYYL